MYFLYTKKPQPRGTVSYSKKVEDLGIYDFSCNVLSKLLLLPTPCQITERKWGFYKELCKKGMSKNTAHCLEYLPEITSISLNHKNKMNTYLKCLDMVLKFHFLPNSTISQQAAIFSPSNCHPQIVFLKSVHCCPFCLSATDQLLATMIGYSVSGKNFSKQNRMKTWRIGDVPIALNNPGWVSGASTQL